MMDDLKLKKFNTIIVKDLSRFSRNYLEAGRYLDGIFVREKIRFIAITDNYDSATYEDEQSVAIKLWLNNMYIQDIGNKIRFSNERRAKLTYMSAGCKFGYKKVDDKYKIVEEDANVVRYIFDLYTNCGLSYTKIARRLTKEKVYSPGYSYYLKNGNVKLSDLQKILDNAYKWDSANISRIITDTSYYGTVINRKLTKHNGVFKKNSNAVEVISAVPAIITKEIYDKALKIRTGKGQCFVRQHNDERLDFVYCSCRAKMCYSVGFYRCSRCHTHVKANKLYPILFKDIKVLMDDVLKDKEALRKALVKKYSSYDDKRYRELKSQKQKIDFQFEKAFEDMINGIITSESYQNIVIELNKKNKEIESEMNLITIDISNQVILERTVNKFLNTLTNLDLSYDENNNLDIFNKLIKRIDICRPKKSFRYFEVTISYKFKNYNDR